MGIDRRDRYIQAGVLGPECSKNKGKPECWDRGTAEMFIEPSHIPERGV